MYVCMYSLYSGGGVFPDGAENRVEAVDPGGEAGGISVEWGGAGESSECDDGNVAIITANSSTKHTN